jgi:Tol biopolymer transport system component
MHKQLYLFILLAGMALFSMLACRILIPSSSEITQIIPNPSVVSHPSSVTPPLHTEIWQPSPSITTPSENGNAPTAAHTPSPTPQMENLSLLQNCSENSDKIVFSFDPRDTAGVRYGIYMKDQDGGNRIRLSEETERTDTMPAWSPNRCWIAFVRFNKGGEDDIFIMSADGKSIRQLTNDPGRDTFPDWSPDGTKISFISNRFGSRNLFVMDANGENVQQLTFDHQLPREKEGYVQWQQWSPDGTEIAFTYNAGKNQGTEIYLIRPDGSGLRKLVSRGHEPAWSPDGNKLFFLSNQTGKVEIWSINRDGSGLSQISNISSQVFIEHSLRASPDGTLLAFSGVGPEVTEYSTEIYVFNLNDLSLRNISFTKGNEAWLDW